MTRRAVLLLPVILFASSSSAHHIPFYSLTKPTTTSRVDFRQDNVGLYEVSAKYTYGPGLPYGHSLLDLTTHACEVRHDTIVGLIPEAPFHFAGLSPPHRPIYTSTPELLPNDRFVLYEDKKPECFDTLDNENSLPNLIDCDDPACFEELRCVSLGAVIHANPVVAVAPELDLPLPSYQHFREAHGARETMLFVAANDGMLHAFALNQSPQELWAYVPRALHPKLSQEHKTPQYYVDATPLVRDVQMSRKRDPNTGEMEATWATVLIGGLRAGGQGFYALDITAPNEPRFLWEKVATDPGFARLGYTYGQAAVGSVHLFDKRRRLGERALAFLPGGYPLAGHPASGRALFVIDMNTGALIREFTELEDGTLLAPLTSSAVASSSFPGRLVTRVFVGDMQGRVLRLDITDPDPDDWTLELFFDPAENKELEGFSPGPVFAAPVLTRDRTGQLVVWYGTGSDVLGETHENNIVASLTERFTRDARGRLKTHAQVNGLLSLERGEKLLSSPILFNHTAYFATYMPNHTRLYATRFGILDNHGTPEPTIDLDGDGALDLFIDFEDGAVAYDLELALPSSCIYTKEDALIGIQTNPPELLMHTNTHDANLETRRIPIPPPETALLTTSWRVIYQ